MSIVSGVRERIGGVLLSAGMSAVQAVVPPPPERTEERDRALDAFVAQAGEKGWTLAVLRDAAGPDADLLFPGGEVELAEAWADRLDRRMAETVEQLFRVEPEPRLSRRVRHAVLARLDAMEPYRAAENRAARRLASPCARGAAARVVSRTVNAIWTAVDDQSSGLTWMTKRFSLSTIYVPVVMAWLGGADRLTQERILDAGLARVRQVGNLKQAVRSTFSRQAA